MPKVICLWLQKYIKCLRIKPTNWLTNILTLDHLLVYLKMYPFLRYNIFEWIITYTLALLSLFNLSQSLRCSTCVRANFLLKVWIRKYLSNNMVWFVCTFPVRGQCILKKYGIGSIFWHYVLGSFPILSKEVFVDLLSKYPFIISHLIDIILFKDHFYCSFTVFFEGCL